MTYAAIRSPIKQGFDCYSFTVRPWQLTGFLGHDPRSQHWKTLPPWLHDIYKEKQRTTAKPRIDALQTYIRNQMMDKDQIGALPPISVMQFEPFKREHCKAIPDHSSVYLVDFDEFEAVRVLIDGLARVTAIQAVRETLQTENKEAYEKLDAFRFSVALYVPTEERGKIDGVAAGQLFHDFNSYAWPVPMAKSLASDGYNPYKRVALMVSDSALLRRHGGLKSGSSNLGKKDTAFATELMLSQFCKIVIEGQRGYGKLTKPMNKALITSTDDEAISRFIIDFLVSFEGEVGGKVFADRTQLFRTAHGMYAIAVIMHDVHIGRTTMKKAVEGLASIDWTWKNPQMQHGIGRQQDGEGWKMNTGTATFDWMVKHCREACDVMLSEAA